MLILKICKQYSHLLERGKTYTGKEFAAIIQTSTKKTVKTLQNSPLFFQASEKGIILDSIIF
jgi:hypothetical protein